jgi:hypothetical protein
MMKWEGGPRNDGVSGRILSWLARAAIVGCVIYGIASSASAQAAPLQGTYIPSCNGYAAADLAPIKLPGLVKNDSCIVAFQDMQNCTLTVQLVLNATSTRKSPIVSYGYMRSVYSKRHGSNSQPSLFNQTTYNSTAYQKPSTEVHLSPYMSWPLPGCGSPKTAKLDWIATMTVTVQTTQQTIAGSATKNVGPAAGGAVILGR